MDEFERLLEKLRKIEALHQGASSDGERVAAGEAHARLTERLREAQGNKVTEWQFSLHDPWKRRLFRALCRKHGLEPYRYYRQRYSTVMLRASDVLVNEVLLPEYEQFSQSLDEYLDVVTTQVVREVLGQEDSDETIVQGELPK